MKQFLIIDFMQKSMVHGIQPGIKFQEGIKNVKWGHKNMKKILTGWQWY